MINTVYSTVAIVLWAMLAVSFAKDRSRYRNCLMLFFAIAFSVVALTFVAGERQRFVLVAIMDVLLLAMLVVPAFLVWNGVLMLRREGRSLANLLSLGLGLAVGAGEVGTFLALVMPVVSVPGHNGASHLLNIGFLGAFVGVSVFYFSMSFVVFMVYCVFLQLLPHKRDFDYVIIHGSGLIDGDKVPKLLADRLDKAVQVYRKDPTPPVLIPSGGRGSDESVSEGEAMERYLLGKGIPASHIVREDRSATTFENLRNSKAIIDARGGSRYTALVTSNYHVYRAMRYCRKIGLKCVGIGSHVAFYYWPSALIREYIAVHAEKKHLAILLAGWLLWVSPLLLATFGG
jgi:uncharacterized SAM-binding protein YcdF (DUF218 family)